MKTSLAFLLVIIAAAATEFVTPLPAPALTVPEIETVCLPELSPDQWETLLWGLDVSP